MLSINGQVLIPIAEKALLSKREITEDSDDDYLEEEEKEEI
jgi:hypothetical protein